MKKNEGQIEKMIDGHQLILGVPVFSGTKEEVLIQTRKSLEEISIRQLMVVFTPTTEQVVMAQHNKEYCAILMQSTLNVPDTVGIQWALRLAQGKLVERMPGVDLAQKLVLEALGMGKKVFLVGGTLGVAAVVAKRFINYDLRFKNLIGFDGGAAKIEQETDEERQRVLKCIREFKPALVLVAYGAPWQEQWVIDNAGALKDAGVKIAMVVGGAFDMWAQKVPRAPLQWQKFGWEWLWRLLHEPWRLKRQLRLVEFVVRVVGERIKTQYI